MTSRVKSRRCWFFIVILFIAGCSLPLCAQLNQVALSSFLQRTLGNRAAVHFKTEFITKERGHDVYELQSRKNKIILRGNNGIAIASALNYYLKNYCNTIVTWNTDSIILPVVLPVVKTKVHANTPHTYRYYLNYCTFNYSMSWWNWERWQKEIDWMALNGINMPLAITGEEAIWEKLYQNMGFTEAELKQFFCGPAYFAWFWMGNLDSWGGPLPQHWMDAHQALQKKILSAERDFGMTPVLPAFTGHVPPSFRYKFPAAKVKKTNWGAGFNDVDILEPEDSMFGVIGSQFIALQTLEYGTDHFYSADTFNENLPPSNDSMYLNNISQQVYSSIATADPKAIWVMQGWMFHYQSDFWKPVQIKALLNAIPDDHMLLLDLYSESHPVWNRTEAYYGKPWVWNMLHNFGGNVSMWGRMNSAANDPSTARRSAEAGRMAGIGLTPEGIEQNPVIYQLMLENVWRQGPVDVGQWLKQYALQRYGVANEDINKAWQILYKTVYNGGLGEFGPESIIVSRPTINAWSDRVRTKLDYNPKDLLKAWDLFITASPALQQSNGYNYDLTDITRQVLCNYALPLQQQFVLAYLQYDTATFNEKTCKFVELMYDIDDLLATRKEFSLDKWIDDARKWGNDENEKKLYERNARDIITLWGDRNSELHEYSNRQWAGLIRHFYIPRWQMFFTYLKNKMQQGGRMETTDFETGVKEWEWQWVNQTSQPGQPRHATASVTMAKKLFEKYYALIENLYPASK